MASAKVRQLEDNLIFKQMTTAAADKTAVDFLSKPDRMTSKDVHSMLMAAGFTPGLGNIADAADALLYAAEGEYGAAGLSAAAMIPFIGQAVSAKKALKVAKESGEQMVTIYRGVDKWHPGEMVVDRKFIGGGEYVKGMKGVTSKVTGKVWSPEDFKNTLWTTTDKQVAEGFGRRGKMGTNRHPISEPTVLEFEVPKSYIEKYGHVGAQHYDDVQLMFEKGLPKEFLTKVHK